MATRAPPTPGLRRPQLRAESNKVRDFAAFVFYIGPMRLNYVLPFVALLLPGCFFRAGSPVPGLDAAFFKDAQNFGQTGRHARFTKDGDSYDLHDLGDGPDAYQKSRNFIRMTAEALHQDKGAPYRGSVSQVVVCDKETAVRPVSFANATAEFEGFYVYADQRQGLTACEAAQAVSRAFWGNIRCKIGQHNYEIKLIFPKREPDRDATLKSLSCT